MPQPREQATIIGQNPAFTALIEQASSLAPYTRPVLIQGERGTGKELVAARLHYLSERWQAPYVTLNCAAMSQSLMDAELFGAEAGAYTGAQRRRIGKLEEADCGTLFLDELASMPMMMQEKLLRFIEYGESTRLGGGALQQLDVRVVAASNQDLPAMAEKGEFRWDLLDRLSFAVLTIPPLRFRRDDILPLATHFATLWCQECHLPYFSGFTENIAEQLYSDDWLGNVRALKNVIERSMVYYYQEDQPLDQLLINPFASPYRPTAMVAQKTDHPEVEASPNAQTPSLVGEGSLKDRLLALEKKSVTESLTHYGGSISLAAKSLGLSYHQLRHLLKKHDVLVSYQ